LPRLPVRLGRRRELFDGVPARRLQGRDGQPEDLQGEAYQWRQLLLCGLRRARPFSQPDTHLHLVAIKVGSLDDSSDFRVQADIWMKSAPVWHHRHEDAKQFDGNAG
jgi:hypothetical protein